jgi:hypothetical protein
MTARARARKRPLPASLASSGELALAAALLQATLTTADYIGAGSYSPAIDIGSENPQTRPVPYGRAGSRHFVLVEISDELLRSLCDHGAEWEDDEPDHDDEPSNVTPCDFRLLGVPVSPLFPKVRA